MPDSVFLDTNVLVYLFDSDTPSKQTVARQVLAGDGGDVRIVISTQVLQEFYVTVTRKLGTPLSGTRGGRRRPRPCEPRRR